MNNSLIKIIGLIVWAVLFTPVISSYAQENNTDIIISEAAYKITVKEKQADVSFSLNAYNYQNKLSDIVICPVNLPLSINKMPKDVFLIDDSQNHKLIFSKQGTFQVEGVFTIPVNINNEIKKISLPLVSATVPKIDITIPDAGIGVIIFPESFYTQKESGRNTIISINPSVKDEITVLWGPTEVIKRPAENASVEMLSRYEVENGVINSSHRLKFPDTYQGLQSVAIILPDNSIPTKLDTPNLDRWFIETINIENQPRKVLHVYLRSYDIMSDKKTIPTGFYLSLSLEQDNFSLGKKVTISPLQLIDFNINKGRIDIITPSDLLLDITRLNEVNQTDAPRLKNKNIVSYNYSNTSASLDIIASQKQPEIFASMEIYSLLHQQLAETTAKVLLNIKNTGINSIKLKIPDGLTKISTKGAIIKSYNIDNAILNISFQSKIIGEQFFYIEYEQPIDKDKNLVILPFKFENIDSLETTSGIKLSTNVALEIISLEKISQIGTPVSEWLSSQNLTYYFQSTTTDWQVKFKVMPLEPIINATIYENIIFANNRLINKPGIHLNIKKAPIFFLHIKIPEDWLPLTVRSHLPGTDSLIKEWNFNEDNHLLRVDFFYPIKDNLILNLELEKITLPAARGPIKIEPLVISETKQSEYWLAINSDGSAVGINLPPNALKEITKDELPPFYKYVSCFYAFHANSSEWSLNLFIDELDPSRKPYIYTNIYTGLIMREGQTNVINIISCYIYGGLTNQLRLQLPPDAINPQINGEGVKNIIHSDDNIKEIKLASKIKGKYFISVIYDIVSSDANKTIFTPLKILDAELESGLIIISPDNERTEIKITETQNTRTIPSIEGIEGFEIKDQANKIAKQLPLPPLHILSFNQPDSRVVFSVKTYELSAFLPAKIVSCDLFSLSRQSGEIITYVSTVVENTAKQYLTVTLPPSAVLWGTYLDDKPVKPIINNKQEILIPLMPEKGTLRQQTNLVFVYVQTQPFASLKKLDFQMPKTDLNIEKATWHLFLPEKYYLGLPEGNMEYVYYDPVITYPSLSRWAIDSISAFIYKIWMAIPPIVKQLVLWILIISLIGFILVMVIKTIITSLLMRRLLLRRLIQIIVYGSGGLLVTVILFGLLIPNLLSTRYSAREAEMAPCAPPTPGSSGAKESTFMDLVKSEPSIIDSIKDLFTTKADEKLSEEVSETEAKEINTEATSVEEANEPQDFRGDVQQLKRIAELSKKSRGGEKQEAAKNKKSLTEQLQEEEKASADKLQDEAKADEFDTESPLKEAGVYDTIGVGSGLGGQRRAGRKGKPSSQPTPTPSAPKKPLEPLIRSLKPTPSQPPTVTPPDSGEVANKPGWTYEVTDGTSYSGQRLFGRTEKGRSVGALPLTVSVPLENTYYYAFESQHLGKEKGHIGFYCFSGAIVLFLQLLGCFVIGGALFYISRQNLKTAIITNSAITIICLLGYIFSTGILSGIFVSGFWFSLLILIGLLLYNKLNK